VHGCDNEYNGGRQRHPGLQIHVLAIAFYKEPRIKAAHQWAERSADMVLVEAFAGRLHESDHKYECEEREDGGDECEEGEHRRWVHAEATREHQREEGNHCEECETGGC
jgi:hypothetical protein